MITTEKALLTCETYNILILKVYFLLKTTLQDGSVVLPAVMWDGGVTAKEQHRGFIGASQLLSTPSGVVAALQIYACVKSHKTTSKEKLNFTV